MTTYKSGSGNEKRTLILSPSATSMARAGPGWSLQEEFPPPPGPSLSPLVMVSLKRQALTAAQWLSQPASRVGGAFG